MLLGVEFEIGLRRFGKLLLLIEGVCRGLACWQKKHAPGEDRAVALANDLAAMRGVLFIANWRRC